MVRMGPRDCHFRIGQFAPLVDYIRGDTDLADIVEEKTCAQFVKIMGIDEERFLDTALLESIEQRGAPGRIAFENPDAVIVIETVGTSRLSFWTREELEKYPFMRVS